jgi:hypothetical protein
MNFIKLIFVFLLLTMGIFALLWITGVVPMDALGDPMLRVVGSILIIGTIVSGILLLLKKPSPVVTNDTKDQGPKF